MTSAIIDTPPALPQTHRPSEVVGFWQAAGRKRWFSKSTSFDAEFKQRFLPAHEAALRGYLIGWSLTAEGALALVLLLDQFPRNAFRDTPRAYETDALARETADQAIAKGFDRQVEELLRPFFYMPFMHSEHLADQQRCVALCAGVDASTQRAAVKHRVIIARFGRFPHRNAVLGRVSTPEEITFLADGGFKG
ncbi:DUF924 domain-containing protein [Ideonella azotifigens]|uniref:DUF924 family protein n=1 Tax=Ideonella azotifigens TaxID=513160 RepID=A0ABP3V4H1_9BURK|nr:DUF924 family protein [Ideonella azotifigens]MCD2341007.1 DUF924 domain-containing protein [Ideonella azotifigens]